VVIVDDHIANVRLLERLLGDAGAGELHAFTDPRQALAHCAGALPDLLLLDLHMPHLDGFEVLEAMRELVPPGRFLPVLVLTADITPTAKQRALAAGAKDFLTKPFDRTEVLLRVTNLLETRALHRQLERQNAQLQTALDEHTARDAEAAAEQQRRQRRIEGALAAGALAMVFQPVADLASGEIVGAEALARFSCEPRRPPNEWFAEAESTGQGSQLELAAISRALGDLDRLPAGAFLALNISPTTMLHAAFGPLLDQHPAGRAVLELTEHHPVRDYAALSAALEPLRRRGARLAVDDTGAGYAGFQHLLRLRPDIVKLDTTLTRGIDTDPARRALATALVAFAHEIGATIIAEGVETADELHTLRHIGVPWGQGYHLARPAPLPLPAQLAVIADGPPPA
jgi:EAL domain-containing protein (putative c-di-GMP-specific phosphodiesterase class I)